METTLNIRKIDVDAAARLKRAAHGRQMTIGEFLPRLLDLYDALRARADAGDEALAWELESRGLQTVQV